MAAFERICSGIPDMDQALDNIRLGDNVVWRVSNLQEFRYFCEPYIEQAIKDNRGCFTVGEKKKYQKIHGHIPDWGK